MMNHKWLPVQRVIKRVDSLASRRSLPGWQLAGHMEVTGYCHRTSVRVFTLKTEWPTWVERFGGNLGVTLLFFSLSTFEPWRFRWLARDKALDVVLDVCPAYIAWKLLFSLRVSCTVHNWAAAGRQRLGALNNCHRGHRTDTRVRVKRLSLWLEVVTVTQWLCKHQKHWKSNFLSCI